MSGGDSMMKSGSESCDGGAGPSTERGKRLCDHVRLLHDPGGQREVEVVFIHGFQLDDTKDAYDNAYWTTWLARDESEDNCWPKTWLATEFPKARILSISYDASGVLKSSSQGSMDLYASGESLVQEMVLEGVDIGQHGCPVVFVCHCVGGLVAKQIIVLGHERFKGDKWIQQLLRNTRAFVFYGTPHGSSELVSIDREVDVGRLNSTFEAIQREVYQNKWWFRVIAETHATSYPSWILWMLFGAWLLKLVCIVVNIVTHFGFDVRNWISSSMIVKELAARHVGYDIIHVAADHFDLCKPTSKRDTSFLYLTTCVKAVVDEYRSILAMELEDPSPVVGVDKKLSVLCERLKSNPIVGLVGMGGVGKTTLSKEMYKSEREHYERCSYLEDVKSKDDIVYFQKQLLRDLCDERWDDMGDTKKYLWKIKQCIETKKVLVVSDDVGSRANLKALLVHAFQNGCSGSKLVITCRDEAILKDYMSEGGRMKVDVLDDEQSMQLFSYYAFHKFNVVYGVGKVKRDIFEREAATIVKACGGLPLSLEVIGRHLGRQNDLPQEKRLGMWKGALKRLKEAEAIDGRSHDEVLWQKLKISYEDLGNPEKRLFLEFACILCDRGDLDEDTIARIWDDEHAIQTLIECSLIKVTNEQLPRVKTPMFFEQVVPRPDVKRLVIHDQLRDMGRWIVRDLAKKHSQGHMIHMWKKDDVQNFLKDNEGSKTLEGLSIVHEKQLCLGEFKLSQAFVNKTVHSYPNLRLLDLTTGDEFEVEHIFQSFLADPQCLTWLCLNYTKISKSHLEVFGANFKALRVLHMRNCSEVVELPSSIGELYSIIELDLEGWEQLRALPDAIGKLGNLQVLRLLHCTELTELPESMGNLVKLLEVDLTWCQSLKRLPCTLGNWKCLKLLKLRLCQQLEAIPAGAGQLRELERLDLHRCESLRTMCEFNKRMHHLHTLDLEGCWWLERFKSLGNLYRLRTLNLGSCERICIANLAECVGQLLELQFLNLEGCGRMRKEVAETVGNGHLFSDHLEALALSVFPETGLPLCSQLKFLRVGDWNFEQEEIPKGFGESLGNLAQLQVLSMNRIGSIPESVGNLTQLQALYVDCVRHSAMNPFPDALRKLVGLEILHIEGWSCKRLPEHVGELLSMRELSLREFRELVELPLSLGSLSQLRSLDLRWCLRLERLPESLGGLTQLREFDLFACEKLECLPESLGGLTQLRKLDLGYCKGLECLPESLGGLTQLRELKLGYCEKLECVPESFGLLTQLSFLDLRGCIMLEGTMEIRSTFIERGCEVYA